MQRTPWTLASLALIVVCSTAACGGGAAQSEWSGPRGGLPYIPLPEKNSLAAELEAAPTGGTAQGAPPPIAGTLPATPPAELSRKASCTQQVCTLADWLPDPRFAKSVYESTPAPTALWLEDIKGGSSVVIPRNKDVDVLGVVLSGKLAARGDEGGAPKMLSTWDALRAPGAGLSLHAEGADARVVLAVATDGASLDDVLGKYKGKAYRARWQKRPGALEVADLDTAEDLAWRDGAYHVRIAFGGREKIRSSLEVMLASPQAMMPEHAHDAWESLAVLAGSGSLDMAGTKQPVQAGAVFQIPKGVKHSYAGSGGDALLAIQLYTPSGPERRFYRFASVKPPHGAHHAHGEHHHKKHEHTKAAAH
jgi:quercetin dioxygenase-like cupin family protein